MWQKFKWDMFVTSFIPLWLSIVVLDAWNIVSLALEKWDDKSKVLENLKNILCSSSVQVISVIVIAFLLISSIAGINSFLKKKLIYAFNLFPELLTGTNKSAEIISDDIKEIRRTVAHGYAYYYDFKTDSKVKYYILLLDKLIKKMSLKWIGFSESEIKNFSIW